MAIVNSSTFNFADVFHRMLVDYGNAVMEETFEAIDEVSKEAVKKLKKESRSKFGGTGDYAKGWMRTMEKKRLNVVATVHGKKPTYSLAHLLENGHAKRNGGRTSGREHIAPVDKWAQDETFDRIVSKLEALS